MVSSSVLAQKNRLWGLRRHDLWTPTHNTHEKEAEMTQAEETIHVQPAVLTTREAAQYLRVSLPTINRRVRSGELPYIRMGRSLRFRLADLDAYLASLVTQKWERYEKKGSTSLKKEE